jgi:hypothetical protein
MLIIVPESVAVGSYRGRTADDACVAVTSKSKADPSAAVSARIRSRALVMPDEEQAVPEAQMDVTRTISHGRVI